MDLITLLRAVQRWPGVILSVMLVTGLVMGWRLRTADPIYEAQVKLQLTAPQDEDVSLYDRYRSSNLRDEMTVARNNFTEVLQSREVYDRTSKKLGLDVRDAAYMLKFSLALDSDFLYVSVQARTPKLAETIANAHTAEAISYFGEVRAKPATATKNYLSDQLTTAQQRLDAAKAAFADFKVKNAIGRMSDELMTYQQLNQRLQAEYDQLMIDGAGNREIERLEKTIDTLQVDREHAIAQGQTQLAQHFDEAIDRNTKQLKDLQQSASSAKNIDAVIAQRRDALARLIELEPVYNELDKRVQQAETEYQLLQNKYTEATLKENTVKAASNIQIVEPALAPEQPVSTRSKLIMFVALIGSLGLGFLLALLLEYITSRGLIRRLRLVSAPAKIGK
jgi:uncharacterized protein involved in exopolysaccharide biosynthesis